MGRPKKATPTVEKAPNRLPASMDFSPEAHLAWDAFFEKMIMLAHTFGYQRVDTPQIEDARLFGFWSSGDDQLLTFNDPKGNLVAAKPTNIFSLVRMYLENQFPERESVTKWFYISDISYINDKKEIKQTKEYGLQLLGQIAPIADAQLINLLLRLFTQAGFNNLSLEINNVGCIECLPSYQEQLKNYFKDKKYDLCENCINHLEAGNPLQILACNNLSCTTAANEVPPIIDFLCENCRRHFIAVLEGLDELGIAYNLNQRVIGKPWSRRTVFEIKFKTETAEASLGQGGHADDLVQGLGGLPASALGFSSSIDTILAAYELAQLKFVSKNKVDVFLVPLGDLAAKKTLRLFTELWNHDILASEFSGPGSIKTQLKLAESNKVAIALIIGQKEARDGTVILRDVKSGMQELFTYERIIEEVKKRLGK